MTNCLKTVTYVRLVLRCVLGSIASRYPRGSLGCVVLYVKSVPLRQGWEAGASVIRCVTLLAFGCILGKLQALAYDILPLRKVPESGARSVHPGQSHKLQLCQTPSTGLRHPSFGGRCRKAMLGVCNFVTLCSVEVLTPPTAAVNTAARQRRGCTTDACSARCLQVNSIKFAGYQVGYIIWSESL